MRQKNALVAIIAVSLLFAAAILLSSYVLDGTGHEQTAMYVLIAIWWIPFSILTEKQTTPQFSEKTELAE